jgi:magnesium transporter
MFITIIDKKVKEIDRNEVSAQEFCIGIMSDSELQESYEQIGIHKFAVEECINNNSFFHNNMESYDDFYLGVISIINMFEVEKMRKDVGFILQKNILLFLASEEECKEQLKWIIIKALERVGQNVTPEKMVTGILDRLLFYGNEELMFTENIMVILEQEAAKVKEPEYTSAELLNLRKRISTLKHFYEQMIDVGECLQENTNAIFEEDELRVVKNFTMRAERMKERSQSLNENLIHVWGLLDAAMNNKLNNTMKVFTIISVIFQPLTMITGWYGMNFINMPELSWEHGYLYVIILNVIIVAVIWFVFKKKKLM